MTKLNNTISFRPAEEKDCRIIWKWANDPESRKASFSSEYIHWEDHVKWFQQKINDSNCIFYVICKNSPAFSVGVVRYEINKNSSVISINIAPNQRRKYIGSQAIILSAEIIFQTTSTQIIHAYIKPDNMNSINAFTMAGYTKIGDAQINSGPAYDYIKTKKT